MVDPKIYVGFSGLVFSFLYRIPQIYRLHTTKSAKDISIWMIHAQNVSYGFYIAYGLMDNDMVFLFSSILSILQNVIIMLMMFKLDQEKAIEAIKFDIPYDDQVIQTQAVKLDIHSDEDVIQTQAVKPDIHSDEDVMDL